jgi:hypothetical protein
MATRGVLQLEDLEAVPVRSEGMPVAIMRRVEEACGIDVHDRPSRGFTE